MVNVSLPVKRKGDNSKTNSVNSIYLYNFVIDSSRRIQRYQTWRGTTKLKIMMTSFPVFDELTFLDKPRPIRLYIYTFPNLKWKFMAVSGERGVISGLEKKAIFRKRHDIIPEFYIFEYIFWGRIHLYLTWLDSTKLKLWWRHFRFLINLRFGSTSPYPNIYIFSNVNRIFQTFLDDKRIASSLEKGRLFVKYTLAQCIFYLSGNYSSRKIQLYPNRWAWTKMKLWWPRCCF